MEGGVFESFFLIFCGAAVVASVALYTRQPLLVAYIAVGAILGPFGLEIIKDVHYVAEMSHIGIIFLLFLLGLDMQPSALLNVLKKATSIALISSAIFGALGYGFGVIIGFSHMESLVLAMASMFSSTIIGIKLLPTTVLHHKHSGDLMVGLLLFQDFIAILCLLVLLSGGGDTVEPMKLIKAIAALPLLAAGAFLFVRFVLLKLIQKFDRFHEYIFLLAIGWCLGLAHLSESVNLSAEIGAFIAGISLATSPISQYIALNLRPLRDFFLVLFFFALGAQLNIPLLPSVLLPALIFAAVILAAKPTVFFLLLKQQSEKTSLAWDLGFRLGQISEFSILIVFVAATNNLIGEQASLLIQTTAILTFIVSSYIVIFNFPNPIAVSDKLRRD
ncbi:cation:proton antiporter [Saccharophagus degradans]|uniref:cation:proton antiporter domain-containing protein n=1 Tax=Saccharophagus degradans TaxID=86304 RepID=UPI001C09F97C|nr:cation:proton antiporter [Saccharophagus degradans]MBU2985678.1 cation:proton antiporter [Saccharophagus degradans]WGO96490.1 cation:proton antiporter [Saccharophagus degradans]